jgi:peptide/nickel transport system permease protein
MRLRGVVLYLLKRAAILLLTAVVAVYVTILIANMGGYVDEIVKSEVLFRVSTSVYQNPAYRTLNETALRNLVNQLYEMRLRGVMLYLLKRAAVILLTVVVAVYVTILIANM